MQAKYAWSGILAVLVALSMVACGNVPDDQVNHGGMFRVSTMDLDTQDVDAIQHQCDPDDPGSLQEVVAARATANFENDGFPDMPDPAGVKLQGYTVEYVPMNGGPQLDPVDFEHGIYVPGGGSASLTVGLVPISTKLQFQNRVQNAGPFQYTVRYEFIGENDYGERVRAQHAVTIYLANFDRTSGC